MEPVQIGNVTLEYHSSEPELEMLKSTKDLDLEEDLSSGEGDENEKDTAKKREGVYEVERIIDRCDFGSGSMFYLVKWKYWNSKYNTWEPAEHLDCEERIKLYVQCVQNKCYPNKCIDEYIRLLANPKRESLEQYMRELLEERKKRVYRVKSELHFRKKIAKIMLNATDQRENLISRMKRDLIVKYLFVGRTRQLTALREWKEEIGMSSNDGLPLDVENNVDLDGPPDNFFYVNEYIPGKGVVIPEDPPVGCKCKPCDSRSLCCSKLAKFRFAYSPHGTLQVPFDTPIYECNKKCKCSRNCANRIVQRGRQIKLCIFRTANGRGWGVKTLQNIKKGSFICCYVGEVIKNEEAETRMENYKENSHTYLFDMDYNGANYNYTVDGTLYGNVSRFVNHSCEPNLTVCFVWIDCLDPSLPWLAFFTIRPIVAGEELTIDYIGDSIKVDTTLIKRTKVCKCGADTCKKFIL